MRTYLLCIAGLIIAGFMNCQPVFGQELLTLEDAIEIGLERNYGVNISRNILEEAENNRSLGNAGFLPTVMVTGSTTERVEDSEFEAGGEARSTTGAQSSSTNAAVNLDWTLFDGLRMFSTYDKLGVLRDISDRELRLEMESLVARITVAYYDIIRISQQLETLANTLDVSGERIEIEETKVDLGSGSEYDLLQARSDFNADRAAYLQERNALEEAKIVLNELLSRPAEQEFEVTGEIPVNRHLSREALFQKVLSENSELALARMEKEVSGLEIREIRGERMPEISLTTGYSFNRSQNDGGFIRFNETTGFSIGLTARVPIFDGFNLNRRIENARIHRRNAELSFEMERLRLESEFATLFRAYQNALELTDLERENFRNAEQTLEIALERFRLGSISSLEFREAQRTFLEAETRLTTALYNAKVTETELLRLSGDLGSVIE